MLRRRRRPPRRPGPHAAQAHRARWQPPQRPRAAFRPPAAWAPRSVQALGRLGPASFSSPVGRARCRAPGPAPSPGSASQPARLRPPSFPSRLPKPEGAEAQADKAEAACGSQAFRGGGGRSRRGRVEPPESAEACDRVYRVSTEPLEREGRRSGTVRIAGREGPAEQFTRGRFGLSERAELVGPTETPERRRKLAKPAQPALRPTRPDFAEAPRVGGAGRQRGRRLGGAGPPRLA